MSRAVLLFCLTMFVDTELRSLEQSVYMSRKSRSSLPVVQSGYYYSKVNDQPATLSMYGDGATDYKPYSGTLGKSGGFPIDIGSQYSSESVGFKLGVVPIESHSEVYRPIYPSDSLSSYNADYEQSKAKYDSHYYPSKMETEAMYEKLKSIMHYKYPDAMGDISYDVHNDYHVDEDDVRSSARASYDGWPYYYHSPYEYDSMKMDADVEKVKDKRYVSGVIKDIIPVHEQVDDVPSVTPETNRFYRAMTTDNPIFGNKPFFSYVLNDYFDKNSDDDHLSFKGMDWGKEFDHEAPTVDQIRNRRLEKPYSPEDDGYFKENYNQVTSKTSLGDSSTEKGYSKEHQFDKHEKGNGQQEHHKEAYDQSGNNYSGFKNFVDTFANKFGGEEQKKDGKYSLSHNQDKGENRKGFHRVYHKDEYQEDKEFFDNKRNSAKAEEKGSTAIHNGGSNAVLQSHATASTGNQANAFNKAGISDQHKFEKNHSGHDNSKGYDSEFNRYRDVAKKAAQSNSADYVNN